ncbi:MAG: PEGA domain-containing protein [Candidatus Aenigmatarchaeota archaeon]
MKFKIMAMIFSFLLILPGITLAICDGQDETYKYKSAIFQVSNARRIKVTVYNSMGDLYPRCFTAWIKIGSTYKNLDGLPYSPSNWYQAWSSTAPNCFSSGYRVVSGDSASAEYDLTSYAPYGYTGIVEVRVSSDCYQIVQDPCFCWKAKVEVLEQVEQYCHLDIYVKDDRGIPLEANIYVDGNYVAYSSHVLKQVSVGTHVVSASKEGYSTDTRTITCSCSEVKRVELVLTRIKVCNPGEIRNRYCACSTQVAYEKCRTDGSGWELIIENCPPGYVCNNGYCIMEKDGWYDTGRERCNMNGYECGIGTREKEQEYRDYTCFGATCTYVVKDRRWVAIGSCYQGCAPGYTCDSGVCVKISTCVPQFLDDYRCYGNWLQRKYLYNDCSTEWVNWKYCEYGCYNGACLPGCEEGYLNNFRCYGNWLQREYRYSDCSVEWINWKYCEYGCVDGSCSTGKPCSIWASVSSQFNYIVGDVVKATVEITNYGDLGGYVNLDAYLCKTDPYCIPMKCSENSVYVPGKTTSSLSCWATVREPGNYRVKVYYSGCDKSATIYSETFSVREKAERCVAKFLDEFKCSGNWKLQLYQYSDCSKSWVHVEYCGFGCKDGACITTTTSTTITTTSTTTTSITLPQEKEIITGKFVLSDAHVALIILLAFLCSFLLFMFLTDFKFKRKKPEWFGEDC